MVGPVVEPVVARMVVGGDRDRERTGRECEDLVEGDLDRDRVCEDNVGDRERDLVLLRNDDECDEDEEDDDDDTVEDEDGGD